MKHIIWILVLVVSVLTCSGFTCGGPTLPPATEGGGFILETLYSPLPGVPVHTVAGVTVQGDWTRDWPGAAGDPASFKVTTNIVGMANESGKRAPASWKFTWISGIDPECSGQSAEGYVALNSTALFSCYTTIGPPIFFGAVGSGFNFSPSPIFTYSPPATATITGSGFDPTYGMPLAQYYNMDGTLVAQELASSVSSDQTTITLAGGDISALGPGTYAGFVNNAKSGGTYVYLGTSAVVVNGPIDVGTTCPPDFCVPLWHFFSAQALGHPYATVTNTYLTSGDSTIWRAVVGQVYDPYPYLVPEAALRFAPGNSLGTFQCVEHIDLSDGAQFDFMFTGTNAP